MSEDELKAIEKRHEDGSRAWSTGVELGKTAASAADVPSLVAEVRRLRGLIKRVERTDNDFGTLFCPWCGWDENHRADCDAFSPDGSVK